MHIEKFLMIQNQLRILHWQTESFAEHKALGKAYEGLDALIDNFVEVHMGKYGKDFEGTFTISVYDYEKAKPTAVLSHFGDFLENELTSMLSETDTELLNIRDEMLAIVNQTKYLLTLS